MFIPRLLSGIILLILVIGLVYCGGELLLIVTLLTSLVGMYELYRVFQMEKTSLAFLSYGIITIYHVNLKICLVEPMLFLMVLLVMLMFIYVFSYPKYEAKHIMMALFGVVYVGIMLSYLYQVRNLPNGMHLAYLVFICSWGCDTCAYCVGMLIGKHKMSPVLSPKKTIEGALGGIIGTAILAVLYSYVFRSHMQLDGFKVINLAFIAAIAAGIAMVGDLTASAVKRNFQIKDYGNLIPGHGGILDRFDSVIITAPIIYYLAYYLM